MRRVPGRPPPGPGGLVSREDDLAHRAAPARDRGPGLRGPLAHGHAAEVEATIRRLSCVQLDSISAVERSHRITLTSRVGAYPAGTVGTLLGGGRVFEYWAHEACLLPVEEWPLFVAQMREGGRRWYGDVGETHPHLAEEILAEIRERGPLGSRHFDGLD